MAQTGESSSVPLIGTIPKQQTAAKKYGRWFLGVVMILAFIGWLYLALKYLDDTYKSGVKFSVTHFTKDIVLNLSVPMLVIFAVPVIGIAVVAPFYTSLAPPSSVKKGRMGFWHRIWTFPVIVKGPLGILTLGEVLATIVFFGAILYILYYYVHYIWAAIDAHKIKVEHSVWLEKGGFGSAKLGLTGLLLFSFLFFPVARGSVLLKALDVPWERAIKYHTWIANVMMAFYTVHGVSFIIIWIIDGNLFEKILEWDLHGNAHLSGFLALLVGWTMWITAQKYFRVHYFETFYFTHHLYILFILFLAMHIGDFEMPVAQFGLFLFMVDRFLRAVQSQRAVGLLSAQQLPCGTLELVIPKPSSVKASALSFIFVNVPGVSRLQWHPFSLTSSSLRTPGSLSVLIKPGGNFTNKLAEFVAPSSGCPLGVVLGVEGPHGHASDFYLQYDTLVLVAGGIGVTPFFSILRDLLTRHHLGEAGLPSDITLIWAVKHASELEALTGISPEALCPEQAAEVRVDAHLYVTREPSADLETHVPAPTGLPLEQPPLAGSPVLPLAGTGHPLATAAILLMSLLGSLLFQSLFNGLFIFPAEGGLNAYVVFPWSLRGLLMLLAMALGISVFGGLTVAACYAVASKESSRPVEEVAAASGKGLVHPSDVVYGTRPNIPALFASVGKRRPGANVGVLVCGPDSLQETVAQTCRSRGWGSRDEQSAVFNFHSVSFDL